MISLPYGGGAEICPDELFNYIETVGLPYLRIGNKAVALENLVHTDSLEYWIRTRPALEEIRRNTMQAVPQVVNDLCETGRFTLINVPNAHGNYFRALERVNLHSTSADAR